MLQERHILLREKTFLILLFCNEYLGIIISVSMLCHSIYMRYKIQIEKKTVNKKHQKY
jgi:hypothetical protein